MSFLREGYPMMGASGVLAIGALAASVWRRCWLLWLLAFALLALAAGVAWRFRAPTAAVLTAAPRG